MYSGHHSASVIGSRYGAMAALRRYRVRVAVVWTVPVLLNDTASAGFSLFPVYAGGRLSER